MQRQQCSNMSFNRRNSSNSSNSSSKLWPRRPSISKVSLSIKKLTSSSSPSSSYKPPPSISSTAKDINNNNNTHAKAIQIIDGSDRTTDTLLSQDEITILHEYQENNHRLHEIREKNLRSVAIACTTEQESIQQYGASNTATANQYNYPPPHTATAVSNRGRSQRSYSSSSKDTRRSRSSSSRSKESRKHPSPQPRRRQRSSSSRGRRQRSSSSRRHSTYESTNISNMTLTATKRQSNNDVDDVELVPTLEMKQSYINHLASQTATAMSTSQECTLPTRRISSGTASTTTAPLCDDHTKAEEEEDECSTRSVQQPMEISFPDICCPHHSYVHLKRYSTKSNKWLTLLEECPVCYKLQLPSLIQEQQEQQKQKQQQQRQKQEEQQKEEEVEERQERRRSKSRSRRRSSTSSHSSTKSSGSYNKIFKIDGQYVLSL